MVYLTHMLAPVYHPSSNGQAESSVKIIKRGLKSIILSNKGKALKEHISKFLFDYRNSRHSTTEKSPAELVYGRSLRTRLDLLSPTSASATSAASTSSSTCLAQTVGQNQFLQRKYYKGKERKQFQENEVVWIMKNLNNKKFVWVEGIIKKKIGNVMYEVYVPEMDRLVKRHLDQIRAHGQTQMSDHNTDWDTDVVPDVQRDIPDSNQTTQNNGTTNSSNSDIEEIGTLSPAHITLSPSVTSTPNRGEGEGECGSERNVTFATPLAESDGSVDELTPIPALNPRRRELSPDNFSP